MALITRIIDLTTKNITGRQDVKVSFKETEGFINIKFNLAPYVENVIIGQRLVGFSAREPEEIGYVGFNNERIVVLCDLDEESIDRLIALESYIYDYREDMFRIPEDQELPQVSIVFTGIPYVYNEGFVPKSKKLAIALRWKDIIKNDVRVKFIAIGDYSAPIGETCYCNKKVMVNICAELSEYMIGSEMIPVHVVNPISDIFFGMTHKHLLGDYKGIWFSPSICSMHSKVYLEDTFIDKEVITSIDHFKYMTNSCIDLACVATSISDFMSFAQEVISYVSSKTSIVHKVKLALFINFSPAKADQQRFYWNYNNLMEFIENRSSIFDVTFYVSDIESAEFEDIDRRLLRYVPNKIELYHTKILESIC